ncbi:hypothetical protein JHK82_042423 [Glycine max]|nr:hypothetical protein JHK82_042423 [Glycine max]
MRSPSRYGFGISQITLRLIMLFFLFFARAASGLNLTSLLSSVPELSQFTSLLASATPLAADLSDRSSLSLLAVPNAYLASDDHLSRHHLSPAALADVLRYHVLLQFLSWSDLRALPPSGKLVTTLLQTTGRATDNFGSVNLTRDPSGVISIRSPAPYSPSNATILSLIKTLPYNVTIFAVNSPSSPTASTSWPRKPAPTLFSTSPMPSSTATTSTSPPPCSLRPASSSGRGWCRNNALCPGGRRIRGSPTLGCSPVSACG